MFPEKINLSSLGHAKSLYKRELQYKSQTSEVAKYKAIGVTRLIGELSSLQAIDFDGGPFLSIGDTLLKDYVITGFDYSKKDNTCYVLITKCST